MKVLIGSLVCAGGVLCATSTWAQERAPGKAPEPARPPAMNAGAADQTAAELEAAQWRQQMNDIEKGLFAVRQRLGLGGRDRSSIRDEEVAQLYDAAEKARKASEEKSLELVKADPEGGAALAQMDDLKKKMGELQQQQRDLEKKLMGISQRLEPARGERGAATTSGDPALATLRAEAAAARKALEDKIMERIKADPEGAKLLQERNDLAAKVQTSREHGQEHRAERQP